MIKNLLFEAEGSLQNQTQSERQRQGEVRLKRGRFLTSQQMGCWWKRGRTSREWSDGRRIATPVASQRSAAWPPALGVLVHLHERQVQQGTEHRGQPPQHSQTHTHTSSQTCKHQSWWGRSYFEWVCIIALSLEGKYCEIHKPTPKFKGISDLLYWRDSIFCGLILFGLKFDQIVC